MPAVTDLSIAAGVTSLFVYYTLRERFTSVAVRSQTKHTPFVQRGIRLLVVAAVVLIVLQSVDIARLPLPLAAGTVRGAMAFVGQMLFWFGVFLILWARETLGHNWAHAADYQVIPGQQLVRHGPYRFVRHPIYAALLLLFAGAELALGSWFVILIVPTYWLLAWQAGREEVLLRQAFREYDEYAWSTGRFFPKIRRG